MYERAVRRRSGSLPLCLFVALEFLNRLQKPVPQRTLQLLLRAPLIEGVDRLAPRRQRDVSAWKLLGPVIFRNKLNQRAVRAGLPPAAIRKIDARWGIFKDKIRAPGITRDSAVAAPFKEGELCFEDLQDISLVLHRNSSSLQIAQQLAREQ